MKKLLTIATLLVVFMGILSVNVNAATKKSTKNKSSNTTTTTSTKKEESSADTVDEIYEIGKKYGMTAKDKQELQNFIDRNGLTNAQVEKLLAKTKEAEKVMTAAGTTDYNKLTKAQKEQLKTIANEAASEVGISLVFRSKAVDIYKDGKKVLVITNNNGKLSYTGNKSNIAVIAVSSVAVIALAAVVIKKRSAVAR
ncbi:MAG: hypothetical protein HFJ44_02925 [Clostridia bacterium]|jgi:hypothetical protein|nr:hypothetical protein [Clostridia bacterium]